MDLATALAFVRARHQGVVTTIRTNGRPQLSNVFYVASDDSALTVSITDTRAKTANMRRDPRVSIYVMGDNFFQYVVLEGTAELSPVARDPHDATVDQLVAYYTVSYTHLKGKGLLPKDTIGIGWAPKVASKVRVSATTRS